MHPIPKPLLRDILADPYYQTCARKGKDCAGRITLEHALTYAGRAIQEKFSILPLCAYHHSVDEFQDGPGLNKKINVEIAMKRAGEEDRRKYPRIQWKKKLSTASRP